MTGASLDVLIAGEMAGVLSQDSLGALSFCYEKGYRGAPLSSAMPATTKSYGDKVVVPYLWGLLPEDPLTRRRIASEARVSANNPFSLLGVIGLDCPGAVQFCRDASDAHREEFFVPATEADIAQRLASGRVGNSGWIVGDEHWSLGGQQSKFALRKRGDEWFFCEGAAATTHILKGGVRGLACQALNEYVCMRLAASCGIKAAKVEYREFVGEQGVEPAIVVERYDRRVTSAGDVVRLHQEDCCQALGCLPENKYTMNGGPTTADVLRLLASTGAASKVNVAGFLQMLFFNYLLAATDAHAKNYSIMLSADGAHRLAPMYDVASIAPYVEPGAWRRKSPKLAMSIGGENRVGRLSGGCLRRMADQCRLDEVGITWEGCAALVVHYAELIPGELAKIFDGLALTAVSASAAELRSYMEEPVVNLCCQTEAALS